VLGGHAPALVEFDRPVGHAGACSFDVHAARRRLPCPYNSTHLSPIEHAEADSRNFPPNWTESPHGYRVFSSSLVLQGCDARAGPLACPFPLFQTKSAVACGLLRLHRGRVAALKDTS
jgi:hypothetical protein